MASLLLGAPPMASKCFTPLPSIAFPKSEFLTSIPFSLRASATSLSTSVSTPPRPLIYCGRGDRKTARGKRFSHSFGNARPKDKKKGRGPPRVYAPPLPPRKDKYDDGEVVKIEIDESLFSN